MKKRVGRPKIPKRKAKAPGISIRLSAEERKMINASITQSGLTQSEFARKALLYWATNYIVSEESGHGETRTRNPGL